MFATAHRVRSAQGQTGINAFVHFHGAEFPWPEEPWHLPNTNPGRPDPARERIDVRPGGNRICAFLDLLAPDGTPEWVFLSAIDTLWLALVAMEADPAGASPLEPVAFVCEGVSIRFGVLDHPAALGSSELTELASALRPLLKDLMQAA